MRKSDIIACLIGVVLASGCIHQQPEQKAKSAVPTAVQNAIRFIADNYKVTAHQTGTNSIAVIWESGAENKFETMRAKVRKDFGVDVKIGAIE